MKNEHGQPVDAQISAARRSQRDVDELIGICRGLASDGRLNQLEAEFLSKWLSHSLEARDEWPGDLLYVRLQGALRDGRLDDSEERELLDLLMKATGGDASSLGELSLTASLPLNEPKPEIKIAGCQFCFTGKFLLGTRDVCAQEVTKRGGIVVESVSKKLDFLVVGIIGSRDWLHSSYGRKIEQAVALRTSTGAPAIVGEKQFMEAIA